MVCSAGLGACGRGIARECEFIALASPRRQRDPQMQDSLQMQRVITNLPILNSERCETTYGTTLLRH